jgi:hypothetical protein
LETESPTNGTLTRTAAFLPPAVTLRISRSDQPQQASTVVLQSWILSCLGSTVRHERAVFRIRTNQPEIGVQLPAASHWERVGLDGRDVTDFTVRDGGKLAVALAPDPNAQDHVLEVWYQTPTARSLGLLRTIELPQVVGATAVQQRYWTLATPPGMHLASAPAGWTPELAWRWQGWFWGRTARLRTAELERWADASVQPPPLADAENQYLFSRFGEDQAPVVCAVVSRGSILGLVSGCVLALGLLTMYSSLWRHPALLFAGGLGLLWLMLWQPDLALAIGQLSGLGFALLACGWCLKYWVDRRRAGSTVIQGATLPAVDSKTIRATPSVSDSRRAITPATSTMPPAASLQVAESKP